MKNKVICAVMVLVLLSLIFSGCTRPSSTSHSALTLGSLELSDNDAGIATYDGIEHDFILKLPETSDNAPLIVMLPGYGNTAEAMRTQTSIDNEANAKGFAVIYVTGAPNKEDRTSSVGWNSGIGNSLNRDVEFLCALVNDLCKSYSLDSERVYAVGFSNGAFMTHRLALQANDIFRGIVSVAGMLPESIWDNRPDTTNISVFQITGGKDDVVPQNINGSANYSQNPAIEDVLDYYIETNSLILTSTQNIGEISILDIYTSAESNNQVWNLYIPDGTHSWPEESYNGFNINTLILEFLDTISN